MKATVVSAKESRTNILCVALVAAAVAGWGLHAYVADESATIRQLNSELHRLRAEVQRMRWVREEWRAQGTHTQALPRPATVSVRNDPPEVHAEHPIVSKDERKERYYEEEKNRTLEKLLNTTAEDADAEYSRVFSELGASADVTKELKAKLKNLHAKAIAAGGPMEDLLAARSQYDKEVRALLGENNFQRYRYYEEAQPAIRDVKQIEEYGLAEKGVNIDAASKELLVHLIKEAQATTTESWHGPYDPLPRPAVGQNMVTNRIAQEIRELNAASERLRVALMTHNIPVEYRDVVMEYYAVTMRNKQTNLELFSTPMEKMGKALREHADKLREARNVRRDPAPPVINGQP